MAHVAPVPERDPEARNECDQDWQRDFDREKQEIEIDRRSPERSARHVVLVKLAGKKISGVSEQPFTHVSIHVLPNFRQQHCRTCQQIHPDNQEKEPTWSSSAHFTDARRTYVKVMMKEHVET